MSDESNQRLVALVDDLRRLPAETEWVEFKADNTDAERIARTVSALSNAATLVDQSLGYILWGIRNGDHAVIGTTFEPSTHRHKSQPLQLWLSNSLKPDLNFQFHIVHHPAGRVVLLQFPAASTVPIKFNNIPYLRIGEAVVKLAEHPDREAALLAKLRPFAWERGVALGYVTAEQVLELLDTTSYFDLTNQRVPPVAEGILHRLQQERLISRDAGNRWNVLNLGAILLANRLEDFGSIARKAVRVIQYKDDGRTHTAMFHLTFPTTIPIFSMVKEIGHAQHPFCRSFS